MKTIKEIRQLTKENQCTYEQAMEMIETQAILGHSFCMFRNLNEDAFQKLFTSGFMLSKHTDIYGIGSVKVEW